MENTSLFNRKIVWWLPVPICLTFGIILGFWLAPSAVKQQEGQLPCPPCLRTSNYYYNPDRTGAPGFTRDNRRPSGTQGLVRRPASERRPRVTQEQRPPRTSSIQTRGEQTTAQDIRAERSDRLEYLQEQAFEIQSQQQGGIVLRRTGPRSTGLARNPRRPETEEQGSYISPIQRSQEYFNGDEDDEEDYLDQSGYSTEDDEGFDPNNMIQNF